MRTHGGVRLFSRLLREALVVVSGSAEHGALPEGRASSGLACGWLGGLAEAREQRERVEVDGDGAVGERLLEGDAYEAVGTVRD
jgi:hypothetical protein